MFISHQICSAILIVCAFFDGCNVLGIEWIAGYVVISVTVEILALLLYFVSNIFYFGDQVKPLNHSHDLPPPGKKGRTYICSCMIFLRPTSGAKLVMKKWIEEMKDQPWSRAKKANDQPAFNWALDKLANKVCSL